MFLRRRTSQTGTLKMDNQLYTYILGNMENTPTLGEMKYLPVEKKFKKGKTKLNG
jgi:hypothetical protein